MSRIDVRSRQMEDARSEVRATLIPDSKSGCLSYISAISLRSVYRKLTKTLKHVWIPPGRNPLWTSSWVCLDQIILSSWVLSHQSLSRWWVRKLDHSSWLWSTWIILLRFGFPTCSLTALLIIGQNVGDFQLMYLIEAESHFEGLHGWPALSFSFCLSVETTCFLGHVEAATSSHVGTWRSGMGKS